MAETALSLRRHHFLRNVENYLNTCNARRLTIQQLHSVTPSGRDGWLLETTSGSLNIVLHDDWPFAPPVFYISKDHPKFREGHIESSGKLCLTPQHSSYSQRDPVDVLRELLDEANSLLLRTSTPTQEFIDEFLSYWQRDTQPKRSILSLLNPASPSRMVRGWHGSTVSVFSDTIEDLERFVKNHYRIKQDLTFVTEPFLWFREGLTPASFPKTAGNLWKLAERLASTESMKLLEDCSERQMCRVAFGFDTSNGPALAGVTLRRPPGFSHGFRNGKVPQKVAIGRFYGNCKVETCKMPRVDHQWIHSRGGEISYTRFRSKKVAIIGCGSLGSGLAFLLAKSGIGKLVLLDMENLSWDNIGRHSLGASAVGRNKAEAVAEEIRRQLPISDTQALPSSWHDAQRSGTLNLSAFDLVISTTGDWPSDAMLNFKARTELKFPTLLFGWLEAHAVAGHALCITDNGGCLACGCDEFGVFFDRLSEWPNGEGFLSEPACGATFQPYGQSQIIPTQSLIATLTMDVLSGDITHSTLRSVVCAESKVSIAGGRWSKRAYEQGIPLEGGYTARQWHIHPNCELC